MEQISSILSTFPRNPSSAFQIAESLEAEIQSSPRVADQIIQAYSLDRLAHDLCGVIVKFHLAKVNVKSMTLVLGAVGKIGNLFGKICAVASAMSTWNRVVDRQLDGALKILMERIKPVFAVFRDVKSRKYEMGFGKKIEEEKRSDCVELEKMMARERILHLFSVSAFGEFFCFVDDSWIDAKSKLYLEEAIRSSIAWIEVEKDSDLLQYEFYSFENFLGVLHLFQSILMKSFEAFQSFYFV
jgi:hypothetical protein